MHCEAARFFLNLKDMIFVVLLFAFTGAGTVAPYPLAGWCAATGLTVLLLFLFFEARRLFKGTSLRVARFYIVFAAGAALFAHSMAGLVLLLLLLGKYARTQRRNNDLGPWFLPALKNRDYRIIILMLLGTLALAGVFAFRITPHAQRIIDLLL